MAHKVVLRTEYLHVKQGGIELHVENDEGKLGTLKVSNGKIEWYPKNAKNGIALVWKKFDELMQSVKTK